MLRNLSKATDRKLGDEFAMEFSPHMAEWVSPTMDSAQSILEIRAQALASRTKILRAALPRDIYPLAGSVSVTGDRMGLSEGERYLFLGGRSGRIQNEAVSGMHVHVGVADLDKRVQVASRLKSFEHMIMAVTSSSPVINGIYMMEQNARIANFSALPSVLDFPQMETWEQYQAEMARAKRFVGVEDATMVHPFTRVVEKFPTVELRMFDNPLTVDDMVFHAYLSAGLVSDIVDDIENGRETATPLPLHLIPVVRKSAALHGMRGDLWDPEVDDYRLAADVVRDRLFAKVERGLARIEKLQGIEPGTVVGEFRALGTAILEHGNGAQRILRMVDTIAANGGTKTNMKLWHEGRARLDKPGMQALVAGIVWENNFGTLVGANDIRDLTLMNAFDQSEGKRNATSARVVSQAKATLLADHSAALAVGALNRASGHSFGKGVVLASVGG